MCWIKWDPPERAVVASLLRATTPDRRSSLDDRFIVAAMSGVAPEFPTPSKVGIDAPLGWPIDFVTGVGDPQHGPLDSVAIASDSNDEPRITGFVRPREKTR